MNPLMLTVAATPLDNASARRIVEEIYSRSDAVSSTIPVHDDILSEAAQELVNLSNAANWRALVAQGLPIATIITILMTFLPLFIKNTTVLEFIKSLIEQILPFFPLA